MDVKLHVYLFRSWTSGAEKVKGGLIRRHVLGGQSSAQTRKQYKDYSLVTVVLNCCWWGTGEAVWGGGVS